MTRQLVDPSTLVLARAECMAQGRALHLTKDCPGPGCPVWDAWHPRPVCTLCDGITDVALLHCKTWTLDGRVCRIGRDIHDGLRCETCKALMPCADHGYVSPPEPPLLDGWMRRHV